MVTLKNKISTFTLEKIVLVITLTSFLNALTTRVWVPNY
jgi:hypothetical protein